MPTHPLLRALFAQCGGLILVWLLAPHLGLSAIIQLLIQGTTAALLGALIFRLPWWWFFINLLLPVMAALMLTLALPPWFYLLGFVLLLLLQWNSAGERVPLYLSNRHTWQALDEILERHSFARFIDLGSGLAGTLFYLAKRHPERHFTGVESAPLPFALSWLRKKLGRHHNVSLHYGSLWEEDLADYDLIYAFLSPAPMPRLQDKLEAELNADALFISNSFPLPDKTAMERLSLADRRRTQLYLYSHFSGNNSPCSSP